MDVAGEGERDAPRHSGIPGAGPVCQQNLERLRRRRPQGQIDERLLWVVGLPVVGIIDAHEGERRAVPLDHVAAVVHEHLPGVPDPPGHRHGAGIVIVVPEHRDTAVRRLEFPKCTHVLGDIRGRDVDHVPRLQDDIRAEGVRLRDDGAHPLLAQVHPGVQIGEVQHSHAVESRRQVREGEGAARDEGHPVRTPDAVG